MFPAPKNSEEKIDKSVGFFIRQMEKDSYSDSRFLFSHANKSEKHNSIFGTENPMILKKPKSFLENKKVLDIEFFRTTPYGKVVKTFEEEDSREQDVIIFMVDVDEIKNDCIVLREVDFSRPVKE